MTRLFFAAPLLLAACSDLPSPSQLAGAAAPLAYETAARKIIAANDAKPLSAEALAAIKAADMKAFVRVSDAMREQAERVIVIHRALQGL